MSPENSTLCTISGGFLERKYKAANMLKPTVKKMAEVANLTGASVEANAKISPKKKQIAAANKTGTTLIFIPNNHWNF